MNVLVLKYGLIGDKTIYNRVEDDLFILRVGWRIRRMLNINIIKKVWKFGFRLYININSMDIKS